MNILDWVLLALFVVGALWGYKSGLIDGLLTLVAVYVAMVLSGQFAGRIVGMFTDSIESDALSTAIGYVVIFVLVFLAARIVGKIVRGTMKVLFLGWVDKLGGLALGLVAGLLIAGAVVTVLARFTYVFEPPSGEGNVIQRTGERFLNEQARGKSDDQLVNSNLTEVIVEVRSALPGRALGMMPDDFDAALDILEERIQKNK
ncbi:MAG: CvpA family protein [Chloroflexi bacterium]|nr:CvpA family protein [Chloroflexota bacterium]